MQIFRAGLLRNVSSLALGRHVNPSISYRLAEQRHKDEIVKFLSWNFRQQEPINRAIGLSQSDADALFNCLVKESLRQPVSILAYDVEPLEAKDELLIGVRLSSITDVQQNETAQIPILPYKAGKVAEFLNLIDADLASVIPAEHSRLVKLGVINVHTSYLRMGVARRMVELSLMQARRLGCTALYSQLTSLRTQNMYSPEKGYKLLRKVYHKNFLDEHGERVFDCEEEFGSLVLKTI